MCMNSSCSPRMSTGDNSAITMTASPLMNSVRRP